MIEEVTPEETTDPVLDMTIMQQRIDELKARNDELEFAMSAWQDRERIDLMNHLLPAFLMTSQGTKSAIKKARGVADECISQMIEEFNAKAEKYRELIEAQRVEEDEKRALIEDTDDGEATEN